MSSRSYSSRHYDDRDRNRDTRRDDRDRDHHYRDRERDYDRNYGRDRERERDRDRDRHRERDRERDSRRHRHDEDSYRPSRRERTRSRSPNRKRSRSRDARDRDERSKRPRSSGKDSPAIDPEEQKQKDKLAKLEAWKKKQAEAKAAKSGGIMQVATPTTPSTPVSTTAATVQSPAKAAVPPTKTVSKPSVKQVELTPKSASLPVQHKSVVKNELLQKVGKFGIQKSMVVTAEPQKKRAMAFGGDEIKQRTLEKLPDMPIEIATPEAEENDNDDEAMPDAPAVEDTKAPEVIEEEEDDPLDAFMSNLAQRSEMPAAAEGLRGQVLGEDDDQRSAVNNAMEDLLAVQQKKKKKDLPTYNWTPEKLTPFRKDFYTETQEVHDMDEEEVQLILSKDNIKVRGKAPPKPVTKWSSLALSAPIMDTIRKLGFEAPTAIQGQSLPVLLSGRDGICIAQTGSGKTLAYMLAVFKHCLHQEPLSKLENGPLALIIAPTRELALQVKTASQPFAKALDLRISVAYGGASVADQIADLKRGTHILVGTPGRLIEMLTIRKLDLKRCTYLVVDEADRLLDMGFQPQLERMSALLRPDHQTALFSATFPDKMQTLARKYLSFSPVEIIVGGRSVIPPNITVHVKLIKPEDRFLVMLSLLGDLFYEDEDARALIFVDRQEAADELLNALMKKGYPCEAIHGAKDQQDRHSALQDFKSGALPILIATSVAARGLDIAQLKLVINWDAPNHGEDFVHRAGRTGRAGREGTAWVFLTEEQESFAPDIVKVLKQSKREVPDDVQKLADDFLEKVKTGKAKVASSGFGGRGLERLDESRDAARTAVRKAFKTGDADNEDEEDEEKKAADKKKTNEIMAKATGQAPPNVNDANKSQHDRRFDFVVQKREVPPPEDKTANAKLPTSRNAMAGASEAAALINARLSAPKAIRPGQPVDNKGPDAGAYHATLEINDFSQKARWAATNRSNIVKLLETGDVSITNKGTYVKPGTEVPAGEQKLYILVEGETEAAVMHAMQELVHLLKHGEEQDANAPTRPGGRYTVI